MFIDANVDKLLESTAQDDPIAMAMFGGAILTLSDMLEDQIMTQRRYADDGNLAGFFESRSVVLYIFNSSGSTVGYNVVTSHLIVTKAEMVQKSNKHFSGLDAGFFEEHRVLYSMISPDYRFNEFMEEQLVKNSSGLSNFAKHSKLILRISKYRLQIDCTIG